MNGGGDHLTDVRIIETLGTLGPHCSLPAPAHLQGLWGEGLPPAPGDPLQLHSF